MKDSSSSSSSEPDSENVSDVRIERCMKEDRRTPLLSLAAEYVRRIRGLDGIQRIALVGSLCTPKANPKDIDILLSLRPGMDLTPLARLSRSLKGATQSMSSGADIFLEEDGRYIGRICGYRECHPRVRCLALHCGARPHLNDDLKNLRLDDGLVTDPPLVVWPEWKAKPGVPEDTLDALRQGVGG
jgi:predicted nucleotidyltransferase